MTGKTADSMLQDAVTAVSSNSAPRHDLRKPNSTNPLTNLSEGQVKLGQIVLLDVGANIEINLVAQKMVRPTGHGEAIKKSIDEVGQLTPCVVMQLPSGTYQLAAGVTRKTACDELGIPCKCIVLAKMTVEKANEWVAQEREANRNQRDLNAAQKALDGARLCVDVFEPAAKSRMQSGKAVRGETGESTELAAKACGIKAASVKIAKKILGTPAEQLIQDGFLKTLSTGKKIAGLPTEKQEAAAKAFQAGKTEEFSELIGKKSKAKKDRCGVAIPNGSPLIKVFNEATTFDKQIDALNKVASFVRMLRSETDASDELDAVDLDKLKSLADQIAAARPHAICPVCESYGKDAQCDWCQGQRWLTAKRYGHFEAAQQEAIKKIKPINSNSNKTR